MVGAAVGWPLATVGEKDGEDVGASSVGAALGTSDGDQLGKSVGDRLGVRDGGSDGV